jgi:cellobiose phosphorylase
MISVKNSKWTIEAGDIQFTFLNSGDLFQVLTSKSIMVNQIMSNPIDGGLNNIYLRVFDGNSIKFFPLIGVKSQSQVHFSGSQVIWEGEAEQIHYQVTFTLTPQGIWFWNVEIEGEDKDIDIIYGQDLGLAHIGAVRSNEAYMSQYIDHTVFNDSQKGYVVCSRQNQPQDGAFPYVQQGSLTRAIGYSTDGFQFFGLTYKETNIPEILTKTSLKNEVYQYEFAYTALQSERVKLNGKAQFVFYGLFKDSHETAIHALEYENEVNSAWEHVQAIKPAADIQSVEKVNISSIIGEPLQTVSMTKEEIQAYFPNRHEEEWNGDTLLSFFTDTHEHIVLKEKELLVERPHGHILMSGNNVKMTEQVITTTSYIYGVFNSHIVVGNTSFNKMLTNTRNALNVMKTSGQRIYVEMDGQYRLLSMPSMLEIGFNYLRWYYKTNEDLIVVENYTTVDSPEIHLNVRSVNGKSYRYMITNQVTMNNNEYEIPFQVQNEGKSILISADPASDSAKTYPDLCYRIFVNGTDFSLEDERLLATNAEPNSASLVVLHLSSAPEFSITIQGLLYGGEMPLKQRNIESEIRQYREFFKNVMKGFELSQNGQITEELAKVNDIAWWFTHNMLVHYSVPHGLEQYGGAAWGTRDVCQGPFEYFMATQKYDTVRDIIKTVYSHQYEDDGNWPQWFMFDQYYKFQQEESHGDIVVWPLKTISDYLAVTKDYEFLNEKVPYTIKGSFEFTEYTATLFDHVKKEIQYIKEHFLHDTHLSSYGDGDWDDTLQPANQQLKKYMVSSWTVALTYQVFSQLSRTLREVDKEAAEELQALTTGIEKDFNHYMLQSGVIPGFLYMEEPGKPEMMLHPTDTKTGIKYRLLPMNRGIISELLSPEQAEDAYKIIKEKLYCPDGVRLMDSPAQYKGGVSTHFKRAEQASNFGREIGLQYVHAHIRFVEAMAKLGKREETWKGLQMVNPVGLQKVVPNADYRQSNTYFSSSDGKFNTRYEAQERFRELQEGKVPVKGGWRIYSSGPGIYMNQLISNCLGIRQAAGNLVIDPVLPEKFDGLQFKFTFMGYPITFVYHLNGNNDFKVVINGKVANGERISNRYRQGGVQIDQDTLKRHLTIDSNVIEIFA